MKTTFTKMIHFAVLAAICAAASTAQAGTFGTHHSLAEDNFTLEAYSASQFVGDVNSNLNVDVNDFSLVGQSSRLNLPVVGTYPTLRELDLLHDFINAPVSQQWQGASQLQVVSRGGSATDGMLKRAAGTPSNVATVAYVDTFRQADGSGYPNANWEIQADIHPGDTTGQFGAVGWLKVGATNSSSFFQVGELWGMLQTRTTIDNDSNPLTPEVASAEPYGRFCLFVNGNDMIFRVDSKQTTGASDGSVDQYLDFNYNEDGFNQLYMTWDDDANAVTVEINGVTVVNGQTLTSLGYNGSVDIYGAGLQLTGAAELDNFAATPEPSSMIMMCFSMLFFGFHNRRNRRRARKLGTALSLVA